MLGVGIFVRNELDFNLMNKYTITSLNKNTVENVWIKVSKCGKNFVVGGMYRHPNGDVKEFRDAMEKTFDMVRKEKKTVIIAGDLNINLINYYRNDDIQHYLNTVLTSDFLPVILMPTRITDNTATLIDHIYLHQPANGNSFKIVAGNLYADITDHLPNFIFLNDTKEAGDRNCNRKMIRLMTTKHFTDFRHKLNMVNWETVVNDPDVGSAYKNFFNKLTTEYENSFPLVQCSRKRTKDKPWITIGLKTSSKMKNRLYKRWITRKSHSNKMKYEEYLKIF